MSRLPGSLANPTAFRVMGGRAPLCAGIPKAALAARNSNFPSPMWNMASMAEHTEYISSARGEFLIARMSAMSSLCHLSHSWSCHSHLCASRPMPLRRLVRRGARQGASRLGVATPGPPRHAFTYAQAPAPPALPTRAKVPVAAGVRAKVKPLLVGRLSSKAFSRRLP